jgi:hypothetical protein
MSSLMQAQSSVHVEQQYPSQREHDRRKINGIARASALEP